MKTRGERTRKKMKNVHKGHRQRVKERYNRAVHAILIHEGTINEATVYPRIIVETALRHQDHSVILAQPPRGSLNPSKLILM